MCPLVLASELAWGDEAGPQNAGDDAGGLSPVALRPLSRMSEEEKQVCREVIVCGSYYYSLVGLTRSSGELRGNYRAKVAQIG